MSLLHGAAQQLHALHQHGGGVRLLLLQSFTLSKPPVFSAFLLCPTFNEPRGTRMVSINQPDPLAARLGACQGLGLKRRLKLKFDELR